MVLLAKGEFILSWIQVILTQNMRKIRNKEMEGTTANKLHLGA